MNTRLIHTLLIAFAILCVTPTMAQTTITPKLEKKFEKLCDKAIKKGKDANGAYHTKAVKAEEEEALCKYLRNRGFIVLEQWGELTLIESIEDYICRSYTSHPYEDFKKNCYLHYYEQFPTTDKGMFKSFEACWFGNVVNGNIDGKGSGFFRIDNDFFIIVDGDFSYGFPSSKFKIGHIYYDYNSNKYSHLIGINDRMMLYDILYAVENRALGSADALTRKAAIAYCGNHTASLPEKERFALDDNAYYNIKSTYDVDYYVGAFPNGRHIHEVAQWVPNDFEGFRIFELETLDNVINLIQTYVKAEMHGGSDLIDASIKKPSPYTMDRINNENEKLLKRASFFAEDIKNNLANDKYALEKVQSFYDYLDILNGFYAVQKSSDISSCIDEDFWGQIASSNPNTTYTLSRLGRLVKSSYEESGKAILKRIDEKHFEEYDFLIETYDYIFNHYSSFIKSVNGRLQMENNSHVRQKLSSSTLRDYKIEDGELVITLQNNDIYRFRQSDGKWKYSSGNTIIVLASSIAYNSIEEAIRGAEKMNREYWEQGK